MDGVLSQEEINALLNDPGSSSASSESELTDVEKDEIGEIANICMGTAATTLFSLLIAKWKFLLRLFHILHGKIYRANTRDHVYLFELHTQKVLMETIF